VRVLVGDASGRSAEHPQAVVDATGDPAVIVDATRRVVDLGTVVLVGEALGRTVEMNFYPDVHVRGLTLVGVASPLQQPESSAVRTDEDPLIAWCHESLVRVTSGAVGPPASAWYAVTA
jgi:threonine dehydrogenase-like Zn-dependent dehydrogenase